MLLTNDERTDKFRVPVWLADQIIDWFGIGIEFEKEVSGPKSEGTVLVSAKVNEKAFKLWALQYGMYVESLETSSLGKGINEAIM